MTDLNAIQQQLEKVASGLQMLGRERKVVLPHHQTFDLIERLSGTVREIQAELTDDGRVSPPPSKTKS